MAASATASLTAHRWLMRAGLSATVFAWIFIFQYFYIYTADMRYAILGVALSYALAQDITLLLTPLAAMSLRHGSKHVIAQAVVLAALALTSLALVFAGFLGGSMSFGILMFVVCMGVYRACYFVPYEVEASRVPRSRAHSHALREMLIALIPAGIGLVLAVGYPAPLWVLSAAAFALILSLIPILRLTDAYEGFAWGYGQTFRELFDPRHQRLVSGAIADGFAGTALLLFWPIAVFLIVGSSYLLLGLVLSLTLMSVLVFRDLFRTILRASGFEESVLVQATLAASSWLLRLVVATPLGVVVVDSYHYMGTPVRRSGVDPYIFEQSADRGSYIDEYTALKEIAMSTGKIFACIFAAALVSFVSVPLMFATIFVCAAAASAASVYFARRAESY